MRLRSGQSSMEYLLIVAFAMVLIVPTFYFFYVNTQKSTDQAVATQVLRIGNEIAQAAQLVQGYGKDAKLTIEFSMPPNVQGVYVRGNPTCADGNDMNNDGCNNYPGTELIFDVISEGRQNQLVFFLETPVFVGVNCQNVPTDQFGQNFINPGQKNLKLLSCGQNVSLYFS